MEKPEPVRHFPSHVEKQIAIHLNSMSSISKFVFQTSLRRHHLFSCLWVCFVFLTLGNFTFWPSLNNSPIGFWEMDWQRSRNTLSEADSLASDEIHRSNSPIETVGSPAFSSLVSTPKSLASKETTSPAIIVDWLSIGSKTRPDLLQVHERLYGQSRWIRKVWTASEEDDTDSQCNEVLTPADAFAIAGFCQRRKKTPGLGERVRAVVSDKTSMMLNATKHPVGWLCAQRRFALGLAKVIRAYEADVLPLPDYLMIVDDDTYYNISEFVKFLSSKDSKENFMVPGAVFTISSRFRFRIHHGGFGLTISRGALKRAMEPILCNQRLPAKPASALTQDSGDATVNPFCSRLNENWAGEKAVFRNGMSLIDLMQTYASEWEPYSAYKNWTTGFCFHGDWLLPYFLVYAYKVGKLVPPYCTSSTCPGVENGECLHTSHVCHHMTAQTMEKMASSW